MVKFSSKGMTFIEVMVVAAIFMVGLTAIVQSQVAVSHQTQRTKQAIVRDLAISDVLNVLRYNAKNIQAHFKTYSSDEIEAQLNYNNLPYTFDEQGLRKKELCGSSQCANRLGYIIQPIGSLPGVFHARLRIYQWIPRDQQYFKKDLDFVFGN